MAEFYFPKEKLQRIYLKTKNKKFIDKSIHDIKIEFFADYIYNLVEYGKTR